MSSVLPEYCILFQKPAWNCQAQCDESTAQYTGGLVTLEKDLKGRTRELTSAEVY